jgi:6,7-dimethyl-8-ribityllumazine synthase
MPSTILIVVSPYYKEISGLMLKGAQETLRAQSVDFEMIEAFGALEIPVTIKMAYESGRYDGFIAIGCVLRGETSHYDIVCNESAAGLSRLALDHGLAIGNAILTCETEEQAWERASPDKMNKGKDAALAVLGVIAARKRFLGK